MVRGTDLQPARFGSGSGQSIESPVAWEEQRSGSRFPPAEIPARPQATPGVCRLGGGMMCFAVCSCLHVVWCDIGVTQIQFKIVQKEFVQFSSSA